MYFIRSVIKRIKIFTMHDFMYNMLYLINYKVQLEKSKAPSSLKNFKEIVMYDYYVKIVAIPLLDDVFQIISHRISN